MDVRLVTDQGVEDRRPEELAALLHRDTGLVWVDIPNCDDDSARVLSEVFAFHPIAIRDCVERNRVPKVHGYGDHVFVVLHAPERGQRGHVHYIELDQFIGRNYLVTVHGPINPAVEPEVALRETRAVLTRIAAGRFRPISLRTVIRDRLRPGPESGGLRGGGDSRRVAARAAGDWRRRRRSGRVHQRVVPCPPWAACRAHHGRAERSDLRTDGRPHPHPSGGQPLVADIADQFDRVRAVADGEKEYLQGVIEFYQTVLTINAALVGQAQNVEVKRLTEASYAQNEGDQEDLGVGGDLLRANPHRHGVRHELRSHAGVALVVGYPAALVLMVLASVALYVVFKRRRWL